MYDLSLVPQYIAYVFTLIPIVVFILLGVYRLKYLNLLICLLISSFLADSACTILIGKKISIAAVVNLQDVIQFGIIVYLYWKFLLPSDWYFETYFKYFVVAYFAITIFFWNGVLKYQFLSWIASSIVISIIAMRHVAKISKARIFNLERFGPFWISVGLILYCSGAISILLMIRAPNMKFKNQIWMFHSLISIIKNICFTLAVWYAVNSNPPLQKRFFSNN
jgi:hypothetical protein